MSAGVTHGTERLVGEVWVVVVAAGSGARFGGPKQFEVLGGEPMISRSLRIAGEAVSGRGGVVAVVPPDGRSFAHLADLVVDGGSTRSDSVRRGLAVVPPSAEVIVVHDGARPLATVALYAEVIEAVRGGADAAVPVVPLHDTIRRVDGGTVDRAGLVAVQTPQAFRAAALREAHADEPDATDDVTVVERAGGIVVTVPGDPRNMKVTEPHDLLVAAALLTASSSTLWGSAS